MLLEQALRLAASRAACTAGSNKCNQNADDGDDHQQLDQRKCRTFTRAGCPATGAGQPGKHLGLPRSKSMTYCTSTRKNRMKK